MANQPTCYGTTHENDNADASIPVFLGPYAVGNRRAGCDAYGYADSRAPHRGAIPQPDRYGGYLRTGNLGPPPGMRTGF